MFIVPMKIMQKKLGDKAKEEGGKYIFDKNLRALESNYAFTLKCND